MYNLTKCSIQAGFNIKKSKQGMQFEIMVSKYKMIIKKKILIIKNYIFVKKSKLHFNFRTISLTLVWFQNKH